MKNLLSFDVEESFQAHNFKNSLPENRWASLPARVPKNTERILQLLAETRKSATFFVVGWIADRHPELIQRISNEGHEVAAHSYHHRAVYDMTPEDFRSDLRRNVESLSSRTGKKVLGFRAPSYTITNRSLWALDILAQEEFAYDSSIYPVRFHPRYGVPDFPISPQRLPNGLVEFPMPVCSVFGQTVPIASGFYFRFMPYWITKHLIRHLNRSGVPVTVNIHPWELDLDQPIFPAKFTSRIRHYYGLSKTEEKLRRLLTDFDFQGLGERVSLI